MCISDEKSPSKRSSTPGLLKGLSNWFLINSQAILCGASRLICKPLKISLHFVCFLFLLFLMMFACLNMQGCLCGLLRSALLFLQLFCSSHRVQKPYTETYWFRICLFVSIYFCLFLFIVSSMFSPDFVWNAVIFTKAPPIGLQKLRKYLSVRTMFTLKLRGATILSSSWLSGGLQGVEESTEERKN